MPPRSSRRHGRRLRTRTSGRRVALPQKRTLTPSRPPADAATSIREHRLVLALLLRVGIGGQGETKVSRYTLFLTLLSAHSCELLSCRVEDRRMEIYIRFGRRRRHERHVVERRQEDAAIQGIEMD